jgi:energy-coupling factor transporter ATP-binding protein EcfA2
MGLIADEPTSQLHLGAAIDVSGLRRELADRGLAVLLVVHDLALAAAVVPRCTSPGSARDSRRPPAGGGTQTAGYL